MRSYHFACLAAILATLSAAVPCRAEADLKLPREKVTLVAPPFVHDHEQVAKSGPKIIEFTLTAVEKPVVIDDAGTTIPGLTYNGSIPGPLMVVHEGDYVEVTLVNPATNATFAAVEKCGTNQISVILKSNARKIRASIVTANPHWSMTAQRRLSSVSPFPGHPIRRTRSNGGAHVMR